MTVSRPPVFKVFSSLRPKMIHSFENILIVDLRKSLYNDRLDILNEMERQAWHTDKRLEL